MTIKELQEEFDNLEYYDNDLMPIVDKWHEAKDDKDLMIKLVVESLFINKINTISMNLKWIENHEGSLFKQKLFKKILTDPTTEADEWGSVKGYGTKMTPEDWEVYEKFHHVLFKMKNVKAEKKKR